MAIAGLYKIFDHWHTEGTLWIISDFHFGDDDLTTGIRNRPSAAEIVQRINAKCGRKDTLICLGDVGDVEYVKLLRAKRKILICGNHDAGRTNYERKIERLYFDKTCYDRDEALKEAKARRPGCRYNIYEQFQFISPFETWVIECDNMLFDEVYEGPLMIAEKLILSHEPVDVPWAYNIHGHDHQGHKRKNHTNVCVDVTGYQPINMNQWMKSGAMAHIETIHRTVIDKATERKKKRGGKKIGEK
jgi:calcineurin-like phosphoesterase family protein